MVIFLEKQQNFMKAINLIRQKRSQELKSLNEKMKGKSCKSTSTTFKKDWLKLDSKVKIIVFPRKSLIQKEKSSILLKMINWLDVNLTTI